MTEVKHRVHIVPWLRRVGRLVLPNWVAITIGRDVFAWRALNPQERRRYGAGFAMRYAFASLSSLLSGGGWYRGNRFEVEAREAERTD